MPRGEDNVQVNIGRSQHRLARVAAAKAGLSLKAWLNHVIEEATRDDTTQAPSRPKKT